MELFFPSLEVWVIRQQNRLPEEKQQQQTWGSLKRGTETSDNCRPPNTRCGNRLAKTVLFSKEGDGSPFKVVSAMSCLGFDVGCS